MKERKKIMQDIELAKMMSEDIDKVYKKYAKSALKASEERAEKSRVKNIKVVQLPMNYKNCTDTKR